MPKINILSGNKDTARPKHVPGMQSGELSTVQPRYRNTGKPPLANTSSFSPQAKKQREN